MSCIGNGGVLKEYVKKRHWRRQGDWTVGHDIRVKLPHKTEGLGVHLL